MMAYYDANGVKLGDQRRGDYFYDANGVPVDKNNGPMFWPRYRPPVLTEEEARDIRNGARMGRDNCLCGMEPTGFPLPEDPIGSFDEE
jgi:hypothetical protein